MTWQPTPPDFAAHGVTQERGRAYWVCNKTASELSKAMFLVQVEQVQAESGAGFYYEPFGQSPSVGYAVDDPDLLWWSEPVAEPPAPTEEN